MNKKIGITLLGFLILTTVVTPFIIAGLLLGPNYFVGLLILISIVCCIIILSWRIGDTVYGALKRRAMRKRSKKALIEFRKRHYDAKR